MSLNITSRLPETGTSIFTVMSKLALEHGAINLSQGFPDFPVSGTLVDLIYKNMKAGHKHDMANALSLGAGEQGTLTWTFEKAESIAMACFEPGHYEAGMKGSIQVIKK